MEYGKTRNDCLRANELKNIKLKIYYAKKFSEATGIEIQSQYWCGNRQLSIEGIAAEYFPTSIDTGNNEEKYEFH